MSSLAVAQSTREQSPDYPPRKVFDVAPVVRGVYAADGLELDRRPVQMLPIRHESCNGAGKKSVRIYPCREPAQSR